MSDKTITKKSGYIYLFITLFLWGIHGPAGRFLALRGVDMYFVAASRVWMGAFVFFIFLLYKRALKFSFKDRLGTVFIVSFVGLFINTIVYHLALETISATLLMILENLSPIFVFLFSFLFLKIHPKRFQIFALLFSFTGMLFIISGKETFSFNGIDATPGIFWGVLAGLTFAFFVFFSGELVRGLKNDPVKIMQFLFTIFVIAAIMMIPLLFNAESYPKKWDEWFWLIEMGVFQSGLAYLFWNYALTVIPANNVSILFLFTIFFTTINELLFLNLSLNIYLIVGGLLIIIAGRLVTRH